ncbi:uncharacterized protein LOC121414360 isoform X2 [Lytechinus variegatus]|uniref:uncharacterized protein LOC121414360 isoform X2 n=1 Tax=Lytechinus variegatus TaxID=7654 RepID=UPI001BB2BB37|nr:uncharacterized protein LOC121414360 isoform X2 [Lytechinus variegatus]
MSLLFQIESLDINDIKLSQRQSASRDLAQFICKMPHLRELHLGDAFRNISPSFHDEFYSTLSSLASSAKIEHLDIEYIDLSQRQSASRDLAQFICKMPHLRELHLGDRYGTTSPSLHEEFYSTLSSLASSAKIERLNIKYIDLSQRQSTSRDLAQFICKMPHLRELHLGDRYGTTSPSLHEEFYSTLSSLASSAKIECLDIHYINLSQRRSASRDLAQFICKMPHLRELCLGDENYRTTFHDEFYSTLSSLASSAKIEILHHRENLSEYPSASRDLAQFICKMNHLKNLTLYGLYHDDFYSTSSSMASSAKIEILHHVNDLSKCPSASRDLAQFICKMNHLNSLTLYGLYHDDFYSTSSSMASSAKIEILDHNENLSERPSASRDFAQFICKMNHLKNLTLFGQYHDDFYSTSSSMASTTKIEILHHNENLSERPSASRDLAQFICKMNHLKNLTLCGQYHDDFYSTASSMASTIKDDCNTSSNVTDLTVTDYTLEEWQDCGSMFDNVKTIAIQVRYTIRCDVIHRIHLPAATELIIQTHERAYYPAPLHDDHTSLPNALHKVSSQLVKVTFTDLDIGNNKIRGIIQAFRSSDDLKHLRTLRFIRCGTDERLDRSSIDSDDEHKVKVEIEHGKPVGENFWS